MNLKTLAVAWTLMWGISYIIVAIVAPDLGTSQHFDPPTMLVGIAITIATLLYFLKETWIHLVSKICLAILGILMVYGGIISWVGIVTWNVPFPNVEIFQVSMAFADLLGAVFMFVLAIEE